MTRPFAGDQRYRTVDEQRIVQMLLVRGWRFEALEADRVHAEAQARAALEALVGRGLPFRDNAGGRLFDPVETVNFLIWAHLQYGDRIWPDYIIATGRREVWEPLGAVGGHDGPPAWNALGPRRYCISIERTFNLAGRRSGERVRLRLPAPIADPGQGDLEVAFTPPTGAVVDAALAPGRLEVSLDVPKEAEVSLGVTVSFTADSRSRSPARLEQNERDLYTRPREGLVKISARVAELARRLSGDETNPWRTVRRFWDFMLDELSSGSIHHDQLDPEQPLDWVLEHGWFDCQVGSALMVALCRARQIPARMVTGYMLHPSAPAFHTWVEAWLEPEGWTTFDLEAWELSAGGRDAAWRDVYFGRRDHRLVVERLPRLFGGLGSPRFPARWHMLTAQSSQGCAVTFEDVDTGALVYREDIALEQLD